MAHWRNRIVGHGEMPAVQFLASPNNWRLHPQNQQDALKGSLDELGWIDEVTVNRRTGTVVDGHLRVTMALREGEDTPIPYREVDLSPEEENLALMVKDPIAALAIADKEKLDALLHQTTPQDAALAQFLSELAAKEGLYQGAHEDGSGTVPGNDVGPCPTLADRFIVPPFSVLDARQGYWQERKRAWLALGIQSELGRRGNIVPNGSVREPSQDGAWQRGYHHDNGLLGFSQQARSHYKASPGGAPPDAARLGPDGKTRRGDGHGRPIDG